MEDRSRVFALALQTMPTIRLRGKHLASAECIQESLEKCLFPCEPVVPVKTPAGRAEGKI